jgi:cell division protein FtsW
MKRILSFPRPLAHRHDWATQIAESLMSIGSGGHRQGHGGRAAEAFFPSCPRRTPTFNFSIIGEEQGLLGVVAVVALYGVVVWRGFRAAFNASEPFGAYLALGLTTLQACRRWST